MRKDEHKSIGQVLKKIREAKGITQLEAAAGARISQAAISKLEAGKYIPRLDDYIRLCEFYGIKFRFPDAAELDEKRSA